MLTSPPKQQQSSPGTENTVHLLRPYLYVFQIVLTLLYGTLLALFTYLFARFFRDPLILRSRLCQRFMVALSKSLPLQVHIQGDIPQTPMLWVANHSSWTDVALLGQLAPLSFLSKAEVRAWPLAGWLAEQGGTLFIRRGAGQGADLALQIRQRLLAGHSLALFPEGTSGDGRQLLPFHGRLLTALEDTDLCLQPVAIRYRHAGSTCLVAPFVGDDNLVQHIWRLLKHPPCQVDIHLLPAIPSQGSSRTELTHRAQTAIATALDLSVASKAARKLAQPA